MLQFYSRLKVLLKMDTLQALLQYANGIKLSQKRYITLCVHAGGLNGIIFSMSHQGFATLISQNHQQAE